MYLSWEPRHVTPGHESTLPDLTRGERALCDRAGTHVTAQDVGKTWHERDREDVLDQEERHVEERS